MRQEGFTLAEVLTAMALLVIAALSTAQLFAATAAAIRVARMKTSAATLAAARLEMLRIDPAPVLSPSDSLDRDSAGFAEFLDADGRPAAAGAAFVRRWAVEPMPGAENVLVVQVLVRPVADDAAGERASRAQVRLVTIRRR